MSHGPDPKPGDTHAAHGEVTAPPVATGGASEEAEHALHHSHNPFDRQVAMTMVVIAALLAGVKVIGHRAHNDTLSLQIESGRKQTEATDKWAEFQAQKFREHLYRSQAELLAAKAEIKSDLSALLKTTKSSNAKEGEENKVRLLDRLIDASERLNLEDPALKNSESIQVVDWAKQVRRYVDKEKDLSKEAGDLGKEAKELSEKSEAVHHKTFYYDMGELFIELSLVLSSVAILTKRPPFWFGGIGVGLIGLVLALIGWFAH